MFGCRNKSWWIRLMVIAFLVLVCGLITLAVLEPEHSQKLAGDTLLGVGAGGLAGGAAALSRAAWSRTPVWRPAIWWTFRNELRGGMIGGLLLVLLRISIDLLDA